MADVVLNITVKDAYVIRALTAITEQAGKEIRLRIQNDNIITWDENSWFYEPKQLSETNKQFVERMIRKFLIAFIKHYEYNIDKIRYDSDILTIIPPSEDVPTDIVE